MPKKLLVGKITSDKMEKTVVVSVENSRRHQFYSKYVKRTKKYMARNDISAKMGDLVQIQESNPLSKNVKWIVSKVIEESKK